MNREIVLKAVQKAHARGLGPTETMELIDDYLEIAGEVNPGPPAPGYRNPVVGADHLVSPVLSFDKQVDNFDDGYIELEASSKKRLATPAKEWVAEDLFNEICKYDWRFEALPEGFTVPLDYRGTPVLNPRGMPGVGVIFTCVDVANPKELPLFFPLTDLKINPVERMKEVKGSVESLLKVRKTPVPVNFQKITAPPAIPSFEPTPDGAATGGMI